MSSNIGQTSNFSPNQISGCQLWLDASTSNNFTFSSGSNISTWIDRSGNSYSATAGNSPRYDSINKRVIFASASSQYMSNLASPLNLAQRSFFFVIQELTNANVCGIMPIIPNPTSGTDYTSITGLSIEATGGVYFYGNGGQYNNKAVASVPLAKGIYAETFASLSGIAYVNGTPGSSSNSLYTPGTSSGYGLGARWLSGAIAAPYYNGYFHEVLVFNNAVSSSNRQILEGYLAWKWGLRTSLPTTHPYYNYPVYSLNMPNVVFPLYSYPVPLFQPTVFSNCTLWLDSSDRSSLTMNNNLLVTQWRDKSGLGNHGSNVGVLQLTSQIGGLPAMTYPGTASTYFTGTLVNSGTTLTVFSVFLMNTSSYVVARILSLARTGAVDYNSALNTAAIQRNAGNFTSYRNNTSLGSITGTFGSAVQVASLYTGSNHTIYMNGTAGTTVNTSGSFGYSNYEVGSSFGEENLVPLNGAIGEVITFNRALPTSERQQMEGYLAWKWGLQGSLGASHPYKSFAFEALPPFPEVTLTKYATNGVWNPNSIGNLQAWFDAADSSSVTVSGSSVTQWRDKSSNAYSVGQPTASNQPSYSTAIQNKKNGIQFATSSFLFAAGSSMPNFTTGSATSVFLAARNASTNTGWNIFNTIWFIGINGGTTRYHLSFNQNTTDGTTLYTNGTLIGQVTSNAVAPSSNAIVGFTASSTSATIHTNGSSDTYAGTTLPAANNSTYFMFGDARNDAQASSDTVIYEMIGYNVQLNITQRQQIEGYLAWKWGLVGNLPSTHPFKLFPPPP